MSDKVREYVIHVEDAKTLYKYTDFPFPLDAYLKEEIVRCRDCDYYDHWDACGPYKSKHVCGYWEYIEINPNGFCAWGERRNHE